MHLGGENDLWPEATERADEKRIANRCIAKLGGVSALYIIQCPGDV